MSCSRRSIICRFDQTSDRRKREGQQLLVKTLEKEKTLFEDFLHALSTASVENVGEVITSIRQSPSLKVAKQFAHEWTNQIRAIKSSQTKNLHHQDPNMGMKTQTTTEVSLPTHQPHIKTVPVRMLLEWVLGTTSRSPPDGSDKETDYCLQLTDQSPKDNGDALGDSYLHVIFNQIRWLYFKETLI